MSNEERQMPLIFQKMSNIMAEIGAVKKGQVNSAQGYKFRGIDDMLNHLYPILVKNKVFMTTETLNSNKELKDVVRSNGKAAVDKHVHVVMKYTFNAEDGSSISSIVPGEGVDSGDKATNKALSSALKYALIQTFSIPTEDMVDGDKDSPVLGQAPEKSAVAALAAAVETPAAKPVTTKKSQFVSNANKTEETKLPW